MRNFKSFIKNWPWIIHQIRLLIVAVILGFSCEFLTHRAVSMVNTSLIRLFFYSLIFLLLQLFINNRKSFCHYAYQYRWGIGCAFIILCTALKLHGSSIGIISYGLTGTDISRVWGDARGIRSDEYVVFTEMALSQVYSGFKWFSDIWGYSARDMFMTYGQPVFDLVTIYRPFSALYILLGAEYGLAFYWVARLVVLILVSFEFGCLITKDNHKLALAYASLVAFSPIVQWWYSVNELVEMLIFGQGSILLIKQYTEAKALRFKILIALGLLLCSGGYIMTLYPAWGVPFAYVFLACLVAYVYENRSKFHACRIDVMIFCGIFIILTISMLHIFNNSADTIRATMNTIYPGHRFFKGGNIAFIAELFRGWSSWLWTLVNVPNPCEKVCFINFAPIGLILSWIQIFIYKRRDPWLITLNVVNLVLVLFLLHEWPSFVGKVSLLSFTTLRAINAVGLINLILLFRCLQFDLNDKKTIALAMLSIFLMMSGIGHLLYPQESRALHKVTIAVFMLLSVYLILNIKNRVILNSFLALCLGISFIGGAKVNPVEHGLSNIYDSAVIKEINSIKLRDPKGLWITSCSNAIYNNIPSIVGAHNVNSLATYPDYKLWQELNLLEKSSVWNRYAHTTVSIADKTDVVMRSTDSINLRISIDDIKNLGVSYILTNNINEKEFDCLENIFTDGNFKILKVVP